MAQDTGTYITQVIGVDLVLEEGRSIWRYVALELFTFMLCFVVQLRQKVRETDREGERQTVKETISSKEELSPNTKTLCGTFHKIKCKIHFVEITDSVVKIETQVQNQGGPLCVTDNTGDITSVTGIGLSWKVVPVSHTLPLQSYHNRPWESGDSETHSPFSLTIVKAHFLGTRSNKPGYVPTCTLWLLRLLCEDLISGHILTEVTFTVLFSSTQAWKFILKTHMIKLISKTQFPKNVFETATSHVLNIHSGPGCFLCSYLLPFTLPSNHKLQKGNKRHREVQQFARAASL